MKCLLYVDLSKQDCPLLRAAFCRGQQVLSELRDTWPIDVPPQMEGRTAAAKQESSPANVREHSEKVARWMQWLSRSDADLASCCCVFFYAGVIVDVCCHVCRLDDSFIQVIGTKSKQLQEKNNKMFRAPPHESYWNQQWPNHWLYMRTGLCLNGTPARITFSN